MLFEDNSESDGESPNGKAVKFADDEAEKADALLDQERSRQELLSKIARLTEQLKDTQNQTKAEKDKRKKKEKSLLKLARELKKRNAQKERDQDRMEELEEKKKYLEHHWVLAQKELDQEKALHAKLHEECQREHERAVEDEKVKHERAVRESETRLAALQKAHADQCEELGREILKANLEADRLHSELAGRGVNVPRRAILENDAERKGITGRAVSLLVVILAVGYYYLMGDSTGLFSRSGLCAPVIPGTILDDNSYGIFRAPWWAPASSKQEIFGAICAASSGQVPSHIEWTRDGKNNKLEVSVEGGIVLKKSVAKAEITSENIRLWKRSGSSEEKPFHWA